MIPDETMADACVSDGQPKDAVQLQLGPELMQDIFSAFQRGSSLSLRLESSGGVSRSSARS